MYIRKLEYKAVSLFFESSKCGFHDNGNFNSKNQNSPIRNINDYYIPRQVYTKMAECKKFKISFNSMQTVCFIFDRRLFVNKYSRVLYLNS